MGLCLQLEVPAVISHRGCWGLSWFEVVTSPAQTATEIHGFILNGQTILTQKSLSELAAPWFLFNNTQFGPSMVLLHHLGLTVYTITPDYHLLKLSETPSVSKCIPD